MSIGYTVEKTWTTEAGLTAAALIMLDSDGNEWHRCGYVGVPESNHLYGKDYSEQLDCIPQEAVDNTVIGEKSPALIITATLNSDAEYKVRRSLDILIDCHGGLTFSGELEVSPDLWFFGFDCNHYDDAPITPSPYDYTDPSSEIRTLDFVIAQCESIAMQLSVLTKEIIQS